MMDIELLRKCAKCVYLATEKEVADDIAGYLNSAADEIISLRQQLTKPADVTCKSTLKRLAIQQADDTITLPIAEYEALVADKARLEFMLTHGARVGGMTIAGVTKYRLEANTIISDWCDTKMEAIDAAIKGSSNG
jgi:hypothetical protein